MSIKITNTKEVSKFKKFLVYGKSGTRKTLTCKTAKNPIIITSENKLESLNGTDFITIVVETIEDFEEAIDYVLKKKVSKKHDWCCIDSISDIYETAINIELEKCGFEMKAHATVNPILKRIIKKIRNAKTINFYVIAKEKRYENLTYDDQFGPEMTGKKMGPWLPYQFDYVFAMRVNDTDEQEEAYSFFQTNVYYDKDYDAKDSSGLLASKEKPDLCYIYDKLNSGKSKTKKKGKKNGKDK